MFCKLALGNVRRSFRDYGVYLLTLTFGVCLFYTFNSVEDQGAILYLREKSHETVRAILTVLSVLSVFDGGGAGLSYFIRPPVPPPPPEKGAGLLSAAGHESGAGVPAADPGDGGDRSHLPGRRTDLRFSRLVWAVRPHPVPVPDGRVRPVGAGLLPWGGREDGGVLRGHPAAGHGSQRGGGHRARLIDLLRGDRKNEVLPLRPLSASVVQFVAGVACLLAAYGILLYFGLVTALVVLPLCAAMLILGTAGTLLLFRSLPRLCAPRGEAASCSLLPGAEPVHPAPVAQPGPLHLSVPDGDRHPASAGHGHHRQLRGSQFHHSGPHRRPGPLRSHRAEPLGGRVRSGRL